MEKIYTLDFKQGLKHEFEIVDFKRLLTHFFNQVIEPHRVNFYQILWFQEGSPTHIVDFKPIEIQPNSFLFVGKNRVHIFDKKNPFKGKGIIFTDSFFCKTPADAHFLGNSALFNDWFSAPQINISKKNAPIETLFLQLEEEWKSTKDPYQSDILRNFLRNLLLYSEREIEKQFSNELKKDADFEQALLLKQLLEENFINEKRVAFYAQKMNITTKKLNQITSKIYGKTPKDIIDGQVLLEAKRRLIYTYESIKEIAYSLGFSLPIL